MKAFVIVFLLSIGQIYAINSYAQETKISLSYSSSSISDILREIEDETEFNFFYNNKLIDVERSTDIDIKDQDIYTILDELFAGTDVEYVVEGKHIVLSNQLDEETNTTQQTKTVSGKVTNQYSEPIPGATVIVKGSTIGTITDDNGEYFLNNIPEDAIITVSFIGMISKDILANKSIINIELQDDIIGLDEVVAIGYGTMKKTDLTSAVSSVKAEQFVKGSVKDIGQLIQGKVAGLTITNSSGDPLSNTSISLRGNTTLNGTSVNPLVLIDGVPGDFNSVAPEDIESIDVLKDGSAAAIYGTRGTNGVILIATKRASGNYDATVEYAAYTSTQQISNQLNMLTANDYRQQITDGIRDASDDLGATTNWLNEITHSPISQVHNLTIRGGNNVTNYLATANYNNNEGIFLDTDKRTFSARTDINHSLFDGKVKLNLGIISRNIAHSNVSSTNYTYRQALIYNPTTPIKLDNGDWYENVGAFNYDNPVARIMESDGQTKSQWSRVNGTVIVNPITGLTLKALFSYSKYNSKGTFYETKNHISTKRSGLNGYASLDAVETTDRLTELTAEYSKSFGKHRITALAGYSYQDNDWSRLGMTNQEFPTDLFGADNIEIGTGIIEGGTASGISSDRNKTNLIGFFSRLNYNFNDRYLLMASLRYEAASQLYGTENPWGFFPAISAGWRISEESFMENISFINDLKLRAGYGITGTQPQDSFLGLATIGYTGSVYSDGKWKQTLAPTRNPNPYLRWEEKKETNLGLDFALVNNRISGAIDLYNRQIDGLLYDYTVPVPPNLVTTTQANVGIMENKGLEVLLNLIPVKNKDFEWISSFNFSTNSNKLVSLSNDLYQATQEYFTTGYTGEPIQTFTHRVDIGDKIGNFYGFKVVDVDEEGYWIYENTEGEEVAYKDFKHAFEDKQVLGNGLPKFYAGWNNTIKYKKFDLSISMRGAFAYQILNFERMYLENTKTLQYNRLKSAYDPIFGKAVLNEKVDLEYNSYYIENGDHWKIDNITVGYNITGNGKYFKGARIYASSLNTLIFTNYKGIDPEVNNAGLDPGNDGRDKYPTTRTFTLGVNFNF
ncbi:MAG: SusC/RagA family TonB-linked outer membrane protein [Prolixibacteraceae bacterium]|nr:SusC/RagA family TonB-linked outer membrane protein [Prolixibacteraceae bacterium]